MALINKIREKSGLAVGVIAVGIGLFIAGQDILSSNSRLLGNGPDNTVGEIDGTEIKRDRFERTQGRIEQRFASIYQQRLPESELANFTWETLFNEVVLQQEYTKTGVQVPPEEQADMVQGRNISPMIQQMFFGNEPYDVARMQQSLQGLNSSPQGRQTWLNIEDIIIENRERQKYDNLLLNSAYVTEAEAKRAYQFQNEVASIKYLWVPFSSVADSIAGEPTDQEIQAYYRENKEKYKAENSRSIKYVFFSKNPTEADTTEARRNAREIRIEFEDATNDSLFAKINTDLPTNPQFQAYYQTLKPNAFPEPIKRMDQPFEVGKIYGPVIDDQYFKIFKVSVTVEDSIQYAKASHILIGTTEDDEATARATANDVLKQLNNGGNFAELAAQYSDDPSNASNGGNLGWFDENTMVPPFSEAVFTATEKGVINKLIKTTFGFHIIRIDETPRAQSYKIATIGIEIVASQESVNLVYNAADNFAGQVNNLEEFTAKAEELGLEVFEANQLQNNVRSLSGAPSAREVIRWAFTDAKEGSVSTLYDALDSYIVAVVTGVNDDGYAAIEDVRTEISTLLRNNKKAEIIKGKLAQATGTLDEMATNYGTDATVYENNNLKLSTNRLTGPSIAPASVGAAFGLQEGQRSKPLQEDDGIVIVEVISRAEAPEIADYTSYGESVKTNMVNKISNSINNALKELVTIVDKRYKFY